MTKKQLKTVLNQAKRDVKSWPKWMQKNENRQKTVVVTKSARTV